MRRWAVVLIATVGCSGGKGSADASIVDAPADAPVDGRPATCEELRDQWNEIVAALDRSCNTRDECGFAGGAGDCECVPSLSYTGSGVAIQRAAYFASASQRAAIEQAFAESCHNCSISGNACICDAAPAAVDCVSHVCVATPHSCLEHDAGPDAP